MDESTGWFIAFRFCDFVAVKGSRRLWSKPDFLPMHFKPFSTSWIMMSDQYRSATPKSVLVKGIVMVTQLSGTIEIIVEPKEEKCEVHCQMFEVTLNAGDIFVFSSDVWTFSYWPDSDGYSITFIAEFQWNY